MPAPKPKKLHFDDDVLAVFRDGSKWREDGLTHIFTAQLQPTLYAKCKKAITAMGGKWVRKDACHVFPKDPRPLVEGLLTNGHLEVERDGFFETPPDVVDMMLDQVVIKDGMHILEPSVGKGAILFRVLEHGYKVKFTCIEKNPDRCKYLKLEHHVMAQQYDFMTWIAPEFYDIVLMNPPFENGQDMEHVARAHQFLKPGGVLVSIMSPHFKFTSDKMSKSFREWLERFEGQVIDLPEGSFKSSGTNVNAVMVVVRNPNLTTPERIRQFAKSKTKAVKVHEPLPDPKTFANVPLGLDDDIVVELNERAGQYNVWPLSADPRKVEAQVRQDFARYITPDIRFDPGTVTFYRGEPVTKHGVEEFDEVLAQLDPNLRSALEAIDGDDRE